MDVEAFLREARKAQLQEYYLRWFPNEEMVGAREKLVERLSSAMRDPQKVRVRFDRLSRSARDFLGALLGREGYRGTLTQIRAERRTRTIEDFEIESLVKSLLDEGLIGSENQPGSDGGWREVFQIPLEIGDALRRTVDLEEREVAKMLSLSDLLSGAQTAAGPAKGGNEELKELARPDRVEARIRDLADPALVDLVRVAVRDFGGILTPSRYESRGNGAAKDIPAPPDAGGLPGQQSTLRLHRPQWRETLERLRLGTTGVISLRDFGIDLEEEGLLIFQELVLGAALEEAEREAAENDREVTLGVDLLADIERVLEIVHLENVEVTREGKIFKKTEERIAPLLITAAHPELFDGNPVYSIFNLCRRLNFFDQDGPRLRCDLLRRRAWAGKRPLAKVREIHHLLTAENRGERWSFHQTAIREIFTSLLAGFAPGKWVQTRALFDATLASYLLSLRERGVDAEFRRRWNEDFQHEKLIVPLEKLTHDLSWWVLHRMALLGLVDLGYREGKFQALRTSFLGAQLLGLPLPPSTGPGKLMVNPDFEVLLFPGAENEAELSLTLSHFADRTASDKVKRYQINSESVKRGVISGMEIGAILNFLEANAASTFPPNVRYTVREWGEGVEPIQRQRVLLLRARSKKGADRLAALLEANEVGYERFGDTGIVVQVTRGERALRELREALRDQGLYLE